MASGRFGDSLHPLLNCGSQGKCLSFQFRITLPRLGCSLGKWYPRITSYTAYVNLTSCDPLLEYAFREPVLAGRADQLNMFSDLNIMSLQMVLHKADELISRFVWSYLVEVNIHVSKTPAPVYLVDATHAFPRTLKLSPVVPESNAPKAFAHDQPRHQGRVDASCPRSRPERITAPLPR